MFKIRNPFKKTLSSILAQFSTAVIDLRALAEAKVKEAAANEAAARLLMVSVEKAESEAEEALAAADRIEELIGSSIVLEAAEDSNP